MLCIEDCTNVLHEMKPDTLNTSLNFKLMVFIYVFNICLFSFLFPILNCKVPPQIEPFDFGIGPANVGEMAMVSCMVIKGDVPLDLFWSLNSVPIISGQQGFSVSRMNARASTLSIDSLQAIHRGLYKCIARNSAGHAEHEAELQVNGALIEMF